MIYINSYRFSAASIDSDAQAFLTAAGITDPTQTSDIDTLVKGLKAQGLWTPMKAIYPFIGGTAAAHKFNLKDPRDLDAAYRLVYNNTPVQSSNGMDFTASNQWADTKLISSAVLSQNSKHLSYYSRENTTQNTTKGEMGNSGSQTNFDGLLIGNTSINGSGSVIGALSDAASGATVSNANTSGFFVVSRTASTGVNYYKNGSALGTNPVAVTSGTQNTTSILIGGGINGAFYATDRQCAFASIGDGLSSTDAANLYTLVQAFQTARGRQV